MTADIVEILRATECDRAPFTPAHALCSCRLANDAANEIERLRAGGCARDQTTTQYCAEVVARDAEIERLRAASQWRPIDSAPKDGTEFIAYRDDAGPFLLRWSCASEMMTESEIEQSMLTEEEVHEPDWFFADFATGGRLNDGFTHWQPLPSPPTQEGGNDS